MKSPSHACVMLAGLLLHAAVLSAAPTTGRPNLIYILVDDAGYGDLSSYGQQRFATPNIDRLAREGMRFMQHYSGSTVCAPSRAALMTGRHTGRCVVRGNREIQPEGQTPMPADTATLPRLLRAAGYRAGAFGKWGLGYPGSVGDPMEHFDVFFGYNCQRQAHTFYPSHLWRNRERVDLDGQTYSHTLIMEEALRFVRENRDQPFFAYIALTLPHAAMQAPEADMAPWRKRFPQFEHVIGKYAGTTVTNPIAAFAAMMTILDRDTGRLLNLLKELDMDHRTAILFSSDNGAHREGGHDPDFFNSAGPFRGLKRDLYEGGIRTFLLARWPGQIAPGGVTDLISAHWDTLPTFCEWAGAPIPEGLDGLSMSPTLLGRPEQQRRHPYLYWEFYEQGGKKAARWENWKAVQLHVGRLGDQAPIEIYDLASDPRELADLAAFRPDLVRRARDIFAEAHAPHPDWTFPAPAARRPTAKPPAP